MIADILIAIFIYEMVFSLTSRLRDFLKRRFDTLMISKLNRKDL